MESKVSDALRVLLQGLNVFVVEKAATPKDVDSVERKYLKELHTDKLSEGDRLFLRANLMMLNQIVPHAARAEADILSLPTFLLRLQKQHYLELLSTLKVHDGAPYCWLCNQIIDERASPSNFTHLMKDNKHWYLHESCLEQKGLETAIKIYMSHPLDAPPFGIFANTLPRNGGVWLSAWVFFINNEFIAGRYFNIFPNLFEVFTNASVYSKRDWLVSICKTLAPKWSWDEFVKQMQPHEKDYQKSIIFLLANWALSR